MAKKYKILNRKDVVLRLRVTSKVANQIEQWAEFLGINKSVFIRTAIQFFIEDVNKMLAEQQANHEE